ncbi:MAG: GHKL domain-containing protein [Lachnospiraceae bacterium]|nr:GHKL domain-containing protein [Lachnospiraceae bacterium]
MKFFLLYVCIQLGELIRYAILYKNFLGMEYASGKGNKQVLAFVSVAGISMSYLATARYQLIIQLVLNIVVLFLMFAGSWKVRLFAYFPLYCFNGFVDEIMAMLFGSMFHLNPLIMTEHEGYSYTAFNMALSIILLLVIDHYIQEKKPFIQFVSSIRLSEYLLISISLFSLTMLMSIVSFCLFMENIQIISDYLEGIVFFAVVSVLIVVLLVFFMVSLVSKRNVQDEMLRIYEQKNEMQEKYYQMLYQKNEEINSFRHDFHHHINYLQQQIRESNYVEVKKYIGALSAVDEDMVQNKREYSGNPVIDAVIYGTVITNGVSDISFHYKGRVAKQIGIKDMDLIVLLSNVLENAVEACKLCEGAKEIHMEIAGHKDNILITIWNTCSVENVSQGTSRFTSKPDIEHHGYGKQNMMRIVERYDGRIESEQKQGEYRVIIQLNQK